MFLVEYVKLIARDETNAASLRPLNVAMENVAKPLARPVRAPFLREAFINVTFGVDEDVGQSAVAREWQRTGLVQIANVFKGRNTRLKTTGCEMRSGRVGIVRVVFDDIDLQWIVTADNHALCRELVDRVLAGVMI